jgi:hypothetical protein
MRTVKYPHIKVKLVGEDGNAFAILGRVHAALRRAGISKEERDAFNEKATAGDYNNLLRVVMETVNDEGDDEEFEDDEDV